jgi:hypothetical protein
MEYEAGPTSHSSGTQKINSDTTSYVSGIMHFCVFLLCVHVGLMRNYRHCQIAHSVVNAAQTINLFSTESCVHIIMTILRSDSEYRAGGARPRALPRST